MSIQKTELDDARQGTLFFLGNLEANNIPEFDLGLVSNFVGETSIITELKNATVHTVSHFDRGHTVISGIKKFIAPVKEQITKFMDAISDRIATIYGEDSLVSNWCGEFVSWSISTICGSLADLIPTWGYVQSANELYSGVKQSVSSAIKWLGQIHSGTGVKLLEGGPSVMAEAIARHNALSVAGGLKDIALTSIKTGLQAAGDAATGVGSLIKAITGILQRIAKLVDYCAQRFLINRTFGQARNQWYQKGIYKEDHEQFTKWFRRSCACTPIIAALTMVSGYAAHPYRFLALISDKNEISDQEIFDKGVKHIEKLKVLSVDYIKEYQSRYQLNFSSKIPETKEILRNAIA